MKGATVDMPDSLHQDLFNRGKEKRRLVQEMFSGISDQYDRLNQLMSLNQDKRWRKIAVNTLQLQEGDKALDLCCGTGEFLSLLQSKVGDTGSVVGFDFCQPMISKAHAKQPGAQFALADALEIPLKSESVDAVSVGWGIRNLSDYDLAHQEIFRVLKPGGRFASLDMALPKQKWLAKLSQIVLGNLLPLLGRKFGAKHAYTYLPQSAAAFWSRDQLCQSMKDAGFIKIQTRDFMMGNICLHTGEKP